MTGPAGPAAFLVVWLATYAVHSTLLLGGTWLLARVRPLSPSLRDTLWKAALVGGLVTASVQAAGGGASLTGSIPLPLPAAAASGPAPLSDGGSAVLSWPLLVALVWFFGAALGVFRLGLAQRRFVRSLGPRRPVMGPLAARLRALRLSAGMRASIRLTTSPRLEGPATLSPMEICLPERALRDLSPGEQESVLAHELGHIARGDLAWKLAALLFERVFFFQPLHGAARRGLAEAAEFLADDWAVERTREGLSLARCLAAVAGWLQDGARPTLAAEIAARESALLRRVERLVGDRTALGETPRRRRLAGSLAALAAVSLAAPGVTIPARQAPTPPSAVFVPAAYVIPLPAAYMVPPPAPDAPLPPAPAHLVRELRRLDAQLRIDERQLRALERVLQSEAAAPVPRVRHVVRLRHGVLARI